MALVIGVLATATLSHAQSYPSSPIMLVNPYAAGGPADVLARPLASAMGDSLGQQVVILNKPGAATAIAAQHVARAPADGYTLLLSTASAHIVTPALTPKIGYDGIRDFAFVAMIASVPNVLVVRSTLPVNDVEALIALAKQKPGTLNYGSVGNGSQPHLAAEMFQQMTGTKLNHIPYKGAAPATTDLLSGQIDLAFLNAPVLLPHIASGKLRALAATTMKRAEQLPDVPTLDEVGLKGFDVATWYGITAPAGTPPCDRGPARVGARQGAGVARDQGQVRRPGHGSLPAAAEGVCRLCAGGCQAPHRPDQEREYPGRMNPCRFPTRERGG